MQRAILVSLVCILFCSTQAWFLWHYLPSPAMSRDVIVSELLSQQQDAHSTNLISAEAFCLAWTGLPTQEIDCRSGRRIDSLEEVASAQSQDIFQSTLNQVAQKITELEDLRNYWQSQMATMSETATILEALDARLIHAKIRHEELVRSTLEKTADSAHYKILFQLLLDLHGQSYQSLQGIFKSKRWDIAQLYMHSTTTIERGLLLKKTITVLPYVVLICSMLLMLLAYWRMQWLGLGAMSIYLGFTLLGLLITADAAVHFGVTSTTFPLNPLGNQLHRQLWIVTLSYCILAFALLAKPWLETVLRYTMRYPLVTTWSIASFVLTAYALQSPAIGSEVLKLGVALLAGILITDQGRVLHLTRKYAPQTFTTRHWLGYLTSWHANKPQPVYRVLGHIARPLLHFCLFGALTIGAAGLVFNDLGGALIATMIMVTALFLAFGSKPTWVVLALLSLVAAGMSQTDKLQSRIELMLAPMTASISDFARLLAFTEASKPYGFGLGQMAWCNQEGTCLPIQVLSDYIPTALNGVAGPWVTLTIFLLMCSYFIALATMSCWRYMTLQGITRLVAILTFFLLMACLIQTLVTFLGNWRLMPLTGLGAPLLSIGLSSAIAPTLALALFFTSAPTPARLPS